jgi:hypothetical protein
MIEFDDIILSPSQESYYRDLVTGQRYWAERIAEAVVAGQEVNSAYVDRYKMSRQDVVNYRAERVAEVVIDHAEETNAEA